jgi:hypothetical protein
MFYGVDAANSNNGNRDCGACPQLLQKIAKKFNFLNFEKNVTIVLCVNEAFRD